MDEVRLNINVTYELCRCCQQDWNTSAVSWRSLSPFSHSLWGLSLPCKQTKNNNFISSNANLLSRRPIGVLTGITASRVCTHVISALVSNPLRLSRVRAWCWRPILTQAIKVNYTGSLSDKYNMFNMPVRKWRLQRLFFANQPDSLQTYIAPHESLYYTHTCSTIHANQYSFPVDVLPTERRWGSSGDRIRPLG